MFGIVLSALNVVLAFVVRSIIVKFVVFFGLFFITTEFIAVISNILPTGADLSAALGGLPGDVWYFLDLFNVSAGIPVLLSAWVTRFIIRRIPVIG
ncbi:hypothetical protein PMI16_03419 [Herbaspirillum sp. CF444]|uniref:DUF2523 family protein n=1 Tax=Herbaspirillum sp. CF444 TaxID=1144319 RepID=UPI0002727EC7|nr:DUF2523 family protein [Herbaspirillum sp. CF444]EJL85639.1 hypothetical protein PMI16_03419 [Herbaspirillum sp. CF444]